MAGRNLTEGVAAERASYRGEPDERMAFTRLTAELACRGLPLSIPEYDVLDETEWGDPEKLMEELAEAGRGRRGLR
ncbi:hypothetical protein [Streptomyces sp. NPDC001770]